MKKNKKIILGTAAALVLAGTIGFIISNTGDKCQDSRKFIGQTYVNKTENGTPIEISFDKDNMFVTGKVVNKYFGNYEAYCNNFSFGQLATTRMMGPPEVMKEEDEYFRFLGRVKNYKVNDDTLVLIGDKKMKFKKQEMKMDETPKPTEAKIEEKK